MGPGHPSFSHGCSQAPEAQATVLTTKQVLHVSLVNRKLSGSVWLEKTGHTSSREAKKVGRYLLPLGFKLYNMGNSLNWKTPGVLDDHTKGDTRSLQRCIYTGSRKSAGPHHIGVCLKAKNLFESRHWNKSANIHSVPGLVLSYVHTFSI